MELFTLLSYCIPFVTIPVFAVSAILMIRTFFAEQAPEQSKKRRRYLEVGKELELVKKSEHAAVFWLKVMGREFASFQGIVHIWGRDYPYRSGFELIILLKDIVGFTERRSVRKNWKAERN